MKRYLMLEVPHTNIRSRYRLTFITIVSTRMSCSNYENVGVMGWEEILHTVCRNSKCLMGNSREGSKATERRVVGIRNSYIHTCRRNDATYPRTICNLLCPVLVTGSQCVDMSSEPLTKSVRKEKIVCT